jgi:hypothetical protein
MSDITLESLIQEHKSLIAILQYGKDKYYYQNQQNYENWLARTRRYLSIHFTNDKQTLEFDSISRNQLSRVQQEKMLAILEALTLLAENQYRMADPLFTDIRIKRDKIRDLRDKNTIF